MNIASLAEQFRRFGARDTLVSLSLRAAERAAELHVLKALVIRRARDEFLHVEPRYEHGFLDESTLRRFARDDVYDLPDAFLDEALGRGDRCYGILEAGKLASFGWYARRPTPNGLGGILHFDSRYLYMYKGFTHHDHRGRRLHALGMTAALSHALAEGLAGLVSYVDSANMSSLRSCYRMGYEDVGRIYMGRIRGRSFAVADAGCRAMGMRVTPLAEGSVTAS